MGSAYQFHSWRVFVIVCALPCVSSVVALTFMPESPRFLLEVTLVVANTQGSHIRWKEFLVILGKYVCLLGRYIFPSYCGTMEGLVSWRHAFQQPACKAAASWPKSPKLSPQASHFLFDEEHMPYCFIDELLPSKGAVSSYRHIY